MPRYFGRDCKRLPDETFNDRLLIAWVVMGLVGAMLFAGYLDHMSFVQPHLDAKERGSQILESDPPLQFSLD